MREGGKDGEVESIIKEWLKRSPKARIVREEGRGGNCWLKEVLKWRLVRESGRDERGWLNPMLNLISWIWEGIIMELLSKKKEGSAKDDQKNDQSEGA